MQEVKHASWRAATLVPVCKATHLGYARIAHLMQGTCLALQPDLMTAGTALMARPPLIIP